MWTKTPEEKETKRLHVVFSTTLHEPMPGSAIDQEALIKIELANQLAKEMINSDLINIERRENLYMNQMDFVGEVNIAPKEITKVVRMKDAYMVKGKMLTDKQVDEAIFAHFPEYFL